MSKKTILKQVDSIETLIRNGKTPIEHIMISAAYKNYMNGDYDAWDLQEVVEMYGFKGWTGKANGTLELHK